MSKGKKIEAIIVVTICALCEMVGIYIALVYREDIMGGTSAYQAEIIESYDGHAIVMCNHDTRCNRLNEERIDIEVPENKRFELGEKILFRKGLFDNKYHYYEKDKVKLKKIENAVNYLTSFPIASLFFYFFFSILYKRQNNEMFRYFGLASAISFSIGMLLTVITEEDWVQAVGLLFIGFPFASPFICEKVFNRKNSQ